jgi:type IV secretion system protein VirB8
MSNKAKASATAPAVSKANFVQYVKEARTWEADKIAELTASRRAAWIVASIAVPIAVMASGVSVLLATKKPDPPVVLRVDNNTGIVDEVRRQVDATTNYDEITAKYFLRLYIRYREGYSRELADEYYTSVGLMSASAEQRRYFDYFNPKNPASPLNVYGSTARVRVEMKSFSFLKPNQALVRWTSTTERNGEKPLVAHWASTIVFRYSTSPIKDKDREVNPLGFQVSEYRRDADTSVGDAPPQVVQQTQQNPAPPSGVVLFPGQAPAGTTAPVVPAIQPQ